MPIFINENGLVDETPCGGCGWPRCSCLCSSQEEEKHKTKTAYLTGYTGKPTRKPEQLRQLAINLDAIVVDSRYSPRSRVAHWNHLHLWRTVGLDRYRWIRDFGNTTFRTGGIALRNPAAGLALLLSLPGDKFIILCACADGESCHRKQVGEYLAAHGWTVREVTQVEWGAAR